MSPSSLSIAFFDSKSYDIRFFEAEINAFNQSSSRTVTPIYISEKISIDSVEKAAGCDAICVFVNDNVTAEIIEKIASLGVKAIALRCAGFNNVDLEAAKKHGMKVFRVPAYSPYSVAEHAVALLLGLNRKIHRAYNRTREHDFRLEGFLGFDLHGKTAGIIGTGKIGALTAEILSGFGMKVLLYDTYPNADLAQKINAEYVDLASVLSQSDVISLHCPLFPETHHILNKKAFDAMKDGVVIVNTSRGGLINGEDLVEAIRSKKVGGAGLDVYEYEQQYFFQDTSEDIVKDETLNTLLTFNNVIITSHQAFFTVEALTAIASVTVSNVTSYIFDGKEENVVE